MTKGSKGRLAHVVSHFAHPCGPEQTFALQPCAGVGSGAGGTGLGGGQPPSPQPFAADSLGPAEAAQLEADTAHLQTEGWVLIPSVIPAEAVAAVRESTLATLAEKDAAGPESELSKRVAGSWLTVNQVNFDLQPLDICRSSCPGR